MRCIMQTYADFFAKTFLFKGVKNDALNSLLIRIRIEERNYQKGEVIYSPEEFKKQLGFVFLGECSVGRQTSTAVIPLNMAKIYDSFGILTCFSQQDEFPTVITAKTNATVLFIRAEDLQLLLKQSPFVSLNVINFLTQKIGFLNEKIAAFSGGSIEEKLASYILSLKKQHNALEFEFNKKKSAESLNCGRASLYRAIDSLRSAGLITLDDKKIIINDLEGLERITK
jgi:CRP-like cAMP-binding protein